MFKLVDSEVTPLTRELTERFYNMKPSPTERDLDESRVAFLKAKAEAGLLLPFMWADCTCKGEVFRVNGRHSSKMLCELNGKFPEGLTAHIDHYEVETEGDLAALFRQFDARKSGRSPADVSGAYQGLHPDLREVAKPSAKLAIDGVSWYRRYVVGLPPVGLVGDDAYSLFNEAALHSFVTWIGETLSVKTPELKRPPIVAAMHATFEANAAEARVFWKAVGRGGVEFEEDAPATRLDGWLKEMAEMPKNHRPDIKPGQYYQGCIYAWNAYREEKTIKRIVADAKKGFADPHE